jgi:hypothetical protein
LSNTENNPIADYVNTENLASTIPETSSVSQEPQQDLVGTKSTGSATLMTDKSAAPTRPSSMVAPQTQSVQYEVQEKAHTPIAQSNLHANSNTTDSQCDSSMDELLQVHDLD